MLPPRNSLHQVIDQLLAQAADLEWCCVEDDFMKALSALRGWDAVMDEVRDIVAVGLLAHR